MQYSFKKLTARTAVCRGRRLHYVKFNEHNNMRQTEAESSQCEGKQESHAFFEWMLRMTRLSVNIAPALLGVTPLPPLRISKALYVLIHDSRP